jgi:hypothetical protein
MVVTLALLIIFLSPAVDLPRTALRAHRAARAIFACIVAAALLPFTLILALRLTAFPLPPVRRGNNTDLHGRTLLVFTCLMTC